MVKQIELNKLKIAIIDSGVDKALTRDIVEIYNYTDEDEFDLNGHGTCTFNYITGHCTNIEVTICKVLNRFGKSKNMALANALTDLLDIDIDIICMPLSFVKFGDDYAVNIIHRLFKKLNEKGVVIVCSYKNGSENSFPACDKYVVGVYGGYLDNNYEFWYKDGKMVTNIYPECVRTLDNKRYFFSGNSKACALAAVIMVSKTREINNNNSYINIYNKLFNDSSRQEWKYDQINRDVKSILYCSVVNKHNIDNGNDVFIKETIISTLNNCMGDRFLNKADEEFNDDYYNLVSNMDKFISLISKKLSIKISDNDIFPYDFINMDYLIYAVSRWVRNYEKS